MRKNAKEKMIDWINARDREILRANSEKCLWKAWNRCLDGIDIAHEVYLINDAERRQMSRWADQDAEKRLGEIEAAEIEAAKRRKEEA